MQRIELLSPAKNLEVGMAAINHGADAVYIGPSQFGARVAAGNSVEDIARLVEYAHKYYARVYVTLNTILRDDELIYFTHYGINKHVTPRRGTHEGGECVELLCPDVGVFRCFASLQSVYTPLLGVSARPSDATLRDDGLICFIVAVGEQGNALP